MSTCLLFVMPLVLVAEGGRTASTGFGGGGGEGEWGAACGPGDAVVAEAGRTIWSVRGRGCGLCPVPG